MTPNQKIAFLKATYFDPYPFIQIGTHEGSYGDETCDIFSIGQRCGPTAIDPSMVIHEMGHLVEVEIERLGKDSWGLINPKPLYIPGMRHMGYHDFNTPKHIEREARVWAFEYNVRKGLGFGCRSVADLCSSYQYLPSIWSIPADGDEKRHQWVIAKVKEAMEWATFEEFEKRWAERMPLLEAALLKRRKNMARAEARESRKQRLAA